MRIPARWRRYSCADYFASKLATDGWNDEDGYPYIAPARRLREDKARGFLIIGGPGVDGLDWGYRVGHAGLWVYDPLDDEFRYLAPTATALRRGYASGAITV